MGTFRGMVSAYRQGAVLLITLGACGGSGGGGVAGEAKKTLRFDTTVTATQSRLLKLDMSRLAKVEINNVTPQAEERFSFGRTDSASMQKWLSDRVNYVLGGSAQLQDRVKVIKQRFDYANPETLPDLPTDQIQRTPRNGVAEVANGVAEVASGEAEVANGVAEVDGGAAQVVMANIGTAIYFKGKQLGVLLGVDLGDEGVVALRSPRTGVLQIGEGLFHEGISRALGGADSAASSVFRLQTFFHEARHSDGHGKTLGFFHVMCPPGHDLANLPACDRNLNGPYTVGAVAGRLLTQSCTDCTTKQKEILNMQYLDSMGRILTDYLSNNDQRRVQTLEAQRQEQEYVVRSSTSNDARIEARNRVVEIESEIGKIRQANRTGVWDDAPEGAR